MWWSSSNSPPRTCGAGWRAWLDAMRTSRPDAEIILRDGDTSWGNHLRNVLKVDVEFVRSWLLAMNEDEDAADHRGVSCSAEEARLSRSRSCCS